MIRTLLIDDEQPARERLRQLLTAHPDVEVVGEAEDGVQAAEQIAELTPDLVLLDIQMPGASGLDVAASLGKPRPAVIFCTAFDQYAVDAFELSALDYLLKPVNRARLAAALDRVRAASAKRAPRAAIARSNSCRTPPASPRPVSSPAAAPASASSRPPKWWRSRSSTASRTWSPPPSNSRCSPRSPRWPAGSMTERFFQVSRTAIIRLDAVKEAKPFSDGTGEIILANGQTMVVARRRWRALLDRLEQ